MGVIIFNGISSKDYHIQVEHPPGYDTPERDYEMVHVPGRNGDLYIEKNSYQNTKRTYEIAALVPKSTFTNIANGINEWLHSAVGYAVLEDSYEPDYFRYAAYVEDGSITNILEKGGRVTVSFNCKPQRFLKEGKKGIVISSSNSKVYNPTKYEALPIVHVKITSNGVLNINGCSMTIAKPGDKDALIINSDLQDCYDSTQTLNLNKYVAFNNDKFPKLSPGNNDISYSGGIVGVTIYPNWWTL